MLITRTKIFGLIGLVLIFTMSISNVWRPNGGQQWDLLVWNGTEKGNDVEKSTKITIVCYLLWSIYIYIKSRPTCGSDIRAPFRKTWGQRTGINIVCSCIICFLAIVCSKIFRAAIFKELCLFRQSNLKSLFVTPSLGSFNFLAQWNLCTWPAGT